MLRTRSPRLLAAMVAALATTALGRRRLRRGVRQAERWAGYRM